MKKGFTLIELLAVIVILAIIALIAIPTISGLIEKARLGAVRDSVYNLIDAAELHYAMNDSDSVNGSLTFTCDGSKCTTSSGQVLKFKGKVPNDGEIVASKDSSGVLNLTIGNYCVMGLKKDLTVSKGNCAGLYDGNNKMIASWNELVKKYHVNIEKDYPSENVGQGFPEGYAEEFYDNGYYKYRFLSQYNRLGYETLAYVLNSEPKFENVVKIVLPNSVKKIGDWALAGLNAIGSIGSGAVGGSNIKSIIIPNSIKEIGNYSFAFNDALTEISIPKSVTSIGSFAFRDCRSLKKIYMPYKIDNVGSSIFYMNTEVNYIMSGLNDVVVDIEELHTGVNPSGMFSYYPKKIYAYGNDKFNSISGLMYTNITEFNIVDGINSINSGAFQGTRLKRFVVHKDVKKIFNNAFDSSIEEIEFEKKTNWYAIKYGNPIMNETTHELEFPVTDKVALDVSNSRNNVQYLKTYNGYTFENES